MNETARIRAVCQKLRKSIGPTPHHALWFGVLKQAIWDAFGSGVGFGKATGSDLDIARRHLRSDMFSAELAGLDKAYVRRVLWEAELYLESYTERNRK